MTQTRPGWILTSTGRQFWPLDPRPEDICIEDIASALANLCRFTGHTREFYSVAQHSVIASELVAPEHALAALLHDASEAYICDITRPVKQMPEMRPYRDAEYALEMAICTRFGVNMHVPEVVEVDNVLLLTERRDLMPAGHWLINEAHCLTCRITPWGPIVAKHAFLKRFEELTI